MSIDATSARLLLDASGDPAVITALARGLLAELERVIAERDQLAAAHHEAGVAVARDIAQRAETFKRFSLEGGGIFAAEVWDSAAKLAREYVTDDPLALGHDAHPAGPWHADHTPGEVAR